MSDAGQSRFGSVRAWWSRRGKFSKAAIIIGALIVVITIIPSGDDTNVAETTTTTSPESAETTTTQQEAAVVTTAAQTTTTTAAPTTSTTAGPASEFKSVVSRTLEGDNNMDKPLLRKVDVVEQIDGGYGVFVEMNANDNLTSGMIRGGIEQDMSKVYMALYQSGLDVRTATVAAYFPMTDQYGAESEAVIYKSMLDKSEADKVNWEADDSLLRTDILPGIWQTTLLHPELQ